MFHQPSNIRRSNASASTRSASLTERAFSIAIAAILTVCMSIPLAAITPSQAYADDAESIMAQVNSIKASIDSAKNEYVSATQVSEQIDAQIAEIQAQMENLDTDIDAKRAKLADILVREYKNPTSSSFITAIGEASSLDEALKQFEYANKVTEDRAKTIREIDGLTEQAQEKFEEYGLKKTESELAKSDAEAAQAVFDDMLEEIRPQLQELRSAYLATATDSSGTAQLESAIEYLENIDGATEAQIALLKSAYRTGYAGADRCEAWTESVYRNAGYSISRYIGAAQCAQALTRSTDLDAIPVGALVFGSGSGSSMGAKYGHVGICVASGTGNGDALIIDNEGSRTKTAVPLDEWSEWQVSTSWVSGKQGAFAWGYPDSVSLAPVAQ